MYDVTVSGASLEEVATKMQAFVDCVRSGGGDADTTTPPKRGGSKGAGTKGKSTADIAAGLPGETIVSADGEDSQPADEPTEEELKALKETHEAALAELRTMYARPGKEGQKAVGRIAKKFGVKKLGDVPVKDANKLIAEVEAEKAKLPADDTSDVI